MRRALVLAGALFALAANIAASHRGKFAAFIEQWRGRAAAPLALR